MSTHRHIDRVCIAALILTLLITVLFMNGEALGIEPVTASDAVSMTNAAEITLQGADAVIGGGGAYLADGDLCIARGGTYVLSGSFSGGIVVNTGDKSAVTLCLNGLSVKNDRGAALRVEQAGSVRLYLTEGSENALESGAEPTDGTDGTVFSRDDLSVCGEGTLTVTSGYEHGIAANDALTVSGGSITVTAPQDGLHANETLTVSGGTLTVSCGDDGLHSDTAVTVEDGSIRVTDCYEGIEAPCITLSGGEVVICPTDDGLNANGGGESLVKITGGNLLVDNPDGRDADGIDSNGSILITGGTVRISVSQSGGSCALDCGTENGGVCRISGGTVIACGSSAMAETFDGDSEQCSVLWNTSGAAAGDTVSLCTPDGTELLCWTLPNAANSFVLSCPEMNVGERYTLRCGEITEEVTLGETSTTIGGAGGMGGGMPAGNFGFGGGRPDMNSAPPEMRQTFPDGGFDFGGERPNMGNRPDGTERPEGMAKPGRPGGAELPQPGEMPGGMPENPFEQGAAPGGIGDAQQTPALLGVSVLVLLAGLLIAAKFKGKN